MVGRLTVKPQYSMITSNLKTFIDLLQSAMRC